MSSDEEEPLNNYEESDEDYVSKKPKKSKKKEDLDDDYSSSYKKEKKKKKIKKNYSEEEEEDSDYSNHKLKHLNKKHKRSLNKKKLKNLKKKEKNIQGFFDVQAEEDENSDDESDGDGEITKEQQEKLKKKYEKQYYQEDKLKQRKNFQNIDEEEMMKKFEDKNYEEIDDDIINPIDPIDKNLLQPSIHDPKIWLIKTKIGKEKECVSYLFHKYIYYNNSVKNNNNNIKIFSAFCFDNLKGYIYIEAYKEANVREAILGNSNFRESSLRVVPMEEMTKIFDFDRFKKIDIKVDQWVRLKSGIYENDLAQIVYIEDPLTKIYIRLVPRLTESSYNNK